MRELAAGKIGAASAHRVKLSVSWGIDANHANAGAWQIRSRLPLRRIEEAIYRWVLFYRWRTCLPLAQCKRNHTDGQERKHDKSASNKMCSSRRVNLRFHNSGLLR